ncbi:MAG TPA: sugar phosphate nucleotidyltransferase [Acidimicrobiales bacterium]|nr:sugar phosphate nucleotidyltransferase [Acidimicrobiales bacterium]
MTDLAGVVLAAGLGTRLRPLTELLPKALCPVANVPLVDLALGRLRPLVGGLAVNVHHHRARMVAHLAAEHPRVHVSNEEGEALGTAGALGRLRPWIDGRAVLVHNADAWFDDPTAGERLLDGWDGVRLRLLAVPARAGLAPDFDGRHTFAGVSLLPWSAITPLELTPSGLWEVSWRQAWDEGRIELVPLDPDAPWFDTGTPATYLAANLAATGGRSAVHPSATVDPTARVERSVVWPEARVAAGERLCEQIRAAGGITVDAPQP